MSEELHAKVLEFLTGEFARKEGRQCVRVDLVYAQGGGFRDEELRTWNRDDNPEYFESMVKVAELVSAMVEMAENHADSFGMGSHRYVVRTRQFLGGRQTHPFKISPSFTAGHDETAMQRAGGGGGGGAAEALGTITQNNLALMRTNQAMFQSSFGTLAGMADHLRTENTELKLENRQLRKELDEATSTKEEKQLEIALKIEKDKRNAKSFDQLMQVGGVVVAKMTGNSATPGMPNALTMLLAQLRDSLQPHQVQAMFGVLTAAQQMTFLEIMNFIPSSSSAPPGPGTGAAPNGHNGTPNGAPPNGHGPA